MFRSSWRLPLWLRWLLGIAIVVLLGLTILWLVLRDEFRKKLNQMKLWERTHMLATLQRIAAMMDAPDDREAPFLYHEPTVVND